MARPTVTLAVIAKNEIENIQRFYDSVEGCFDEYVLVDTGSTDGTAEKAKELGFKVSHFDWIDDFAAARNFSFEQATSDYIAWLDLDDALQNKDAFIKFRDDVMGLADYWVANYHYAINAEGKPVCSFVRERVIKKSRGFKWKYFLHEGIIPSLDSGEPVRAQFIGTWDVKHMRTEADLKKDKSRNITIFEKQIKKQPLDARMTFYYGKELYEAQRPDECITQLLKAIAEPKLEAHDRILALQYLCFAYMQTNQFEQAINHAHSGLMLSPNRAEFHVICGDSFLKLNRLADSVPHYTAARACVKQTQGNFTGAIFDNPDAYTVYPVNQLARVWAHLGNLDKAADYAREGVIKYNNAESKLLLEEVKKHQAIVIDRSKAKSVDDIVITCPFSPYEWDPKVYKEKAMGGSETAAIEMAYWLKKLSGRPVKVFNPRASYGSFDGVDYIPINSVNQYMAENKPALHIAWRHNLKMTDAITKLWCHDLTTPGAENTQNYDKIMCLTPFHKRYVMAMQGIPEDKIYVTRNGIVPERFTDGPWEKDPYKFIFSSSPDRGLDRAMLVLDEVRKKYPEIKLHIFYGIEHLPKYSHQALHDKLKAMIEERKDYVIYHGSTQQDELMRQFKTAAYCVQPSDWIETSMISAMERLQCGVYQIIRKVGGCVDTLSEASENGWATLVDSECITPDEFRVYVDATIDAIEKQAYKNIQINPHAHSWESVARQWLKDFL